MLTPGKAYRKAKVEKKPNISYYDVGSNVNLTCEAEKNTNLYQIIWKKLDSQGNPMKLKSALNGTGILTLTLNLLSGKNSGRYECVISRPQVNYYNSRVVNINVKGMVLLTSCLLVATAKVASIIQKMMHAIQKSS